MHFYFAYYNLNLEDIILALPVLAVILALIFRRKYYKLAIIIAILSFCVALYPHLATSNLNSCHSVHNCSSIRASSLTNYLWIGLITFLLSITAILLSIVKPLEPHIAVANSPGASPELLTQHSYAKRTASITILALIELSALGVAALAGISILFGIGIPIEAGLLFFMVMNYKFISHIRTNRLMPKKSLYLYISSIFIAGLVCGYGGYFLGSFGNIDTTGVPSSSELLKVLFIDIVFIVTLLAITLSWQKSSDSTQNSNQ